MDIRMFISAIRIETESWFWDMRRMAEGMEEADLKWEVVLWVGRRTDTRPSELGNMKREQTLFSIVSCIIGTCNFQKLATGTHLKGNSQETFMPVWQTELISSQSSLSVWKSSEMPFVAPNGSEIAEELCIFKYISIHRQWNYQHRCKRILRFVLRQAARD